MKNHPTLLFVFFLISTNLYSAPIKISSYIGTTIAGDIGQFQETISKKRSDTRKEYINHLINATIRISQGYFQPASLIDYVMQAQELADNKRDINLEIDKVGIGISAGEIFKSEFEKLYEENRINLKERKVEFVSELPQISSTRKISGKFPFTHYVQLTVIHTGGGSFKISGALGKILSSDVGIDRIFQSEGNLIDGLAGVAKNMFIAIHQVEYESWNNPQSQLKWLIGPAKNVTRAEAKLYCDGQKARLPFADELIMAEQGGGLREGSIRTFKKFDSYHIADQRSQKGDLVLQISEDLQISRLEKSAKIWCVRGELSQRQVLINKIFNERRKLDSKGYNLYYFKELVKPENLRELIAIESYLIDLGVLGHDINKTLSSSDYIDSKTYVPILQIILKDINLDMSYH